MRASIVVQVGCAGMAFLGMACTGNVLLGDDHANAASRGEAAGSGTQPDASLATISDDAGRAWAPPDGAERANDPPNRVIPTGGTVLSDSDTDPTAIAVDSAHLYWTTRGSSPSVTPPIADGAVMRMPKGGGARFAFVSGQVRPLAVARSGDDLYWGGVEQDNPPIYRRELSAGSTVSVDHTGGHLLLQDSANIFWAHRSIRQMSKLDGKITTLFTTSQPELGAVAIGGDRVFFVELGYRDIYSVPIGGGPVETVVARTSAPYFKIAADSTQVYWFNPGESAIYSAPHAGGAITKVADTGGPPNALAVYEGALYWTIPPAASWNECDGRSEGWPSLQTIATTGGPVRTLANGYPTTVAFTFDKTAVYWITSGDGCTPSVRWKVMTAPR